MEDRKTEGSATIHDWMGSWLKMAPDVGGELAKICLGFGGQNVSTPGGSPPAGRFTEFWYGNQKSWEAAFKALRIELEGAIFQTTSDTEVILHLAARSRTADVVDAIVDALRQVRGAYSLLFLVPGRLIAVRDPLGFRPLSLGRVDGAWVLASETCAFDLIGAEHVRDIERGEVVVADVAGVHSFRPFQAARAAPCAFEHVYFSRPDSLVFGQSVQAARQRLGEELFREHPADVDAVVPVPD